MIGSSGGGDAREAAFLMKLVFVVVVVVSVALHGSECEDDVPVEQEDVPVKQEDVPGPKSTSESGSTEKKWSTVKYEMRYDNRRGRGRGMGMGRGRGARVPSWWTTAVTGKYARRTTRFVEPFAAKSNFTYQKRNKTTKIPKTTIFTVNFRKAGEEWQGSEERPKYRRTFEDYRERRRRERGGWRRQERRYDDRSWRRAPWRQSERYSDDRWDTGARRYPPASAYERHDTGWASPSTSTVRKLQTSVFDDNRHFFESLLPAIGKLSLDERLQFRSEVLDALKRIRGPPDDESLPPSTTRP